MRTGHRGAGHPGTDAGVGFMYAPKRDVLGPFGELDLLFIHRFDVNRDVTKLANTIDAMRKEGREAEAKARTDANKAKIAAVKPLERATRSLSAMNKQRDAIVADRKLTPAEKRKKLDELQMQRNQLTKRMMTDPAIRAAQ